MIDGESATKDCLSNFHTALYSCDLKKLQLYNPLPFHLAIHRSCSSYWLSGILSCSNCGHNCLTKVLSLYEFKHDFILIRLLLGLGGQQIHMHSNLNKHSKKLTKQTIRMLSLNFLRIVLFNTGYKTDLCLIHYVHNFSAVGF